MLKSKEGHVISLAGSLALALVTQRTQQNSDTGSSSFSVFRLLIQSYLCHSNHF